MVTGILKFCIIECNEEIMTFDELVGLLGNFNEKNGFSILTKSTRMIKTAYLNKMMCWNAQNKSDDLVNDEN